MKSIAPEFKKTFLICSEIVKLSTSEELGREAKLSYLRNIQEVLTDAIDRLESRRRD